MLFVDSLQVGGAETLLVRNALAFKQYGEEVFVVVNRLVGSFLEKQLMDNGIEVKPLVGPKRFTRGYRLLRKMVGVKRNRTKAWKKMLEEIQPDVVHLHSAPDILLEKLPFPASRIAFSFHTSVDRVLGKLNERQRRSLDYLARSGGMMVSISSTVEDGVNESLHPCQSHLIPNCFDVSDISNMKSDRTDFLEAYNLPQDSFILVHVGRFHPVKNHEKLLGILKEMLAQQPLAYLVLVGDGSSERKEELKRRVDEMGLEEHVIFYGLSEAPAELMSISDAVALPSHVEGFSLVALEAQVLGKRCIVASSVPPEVKCQPNFLFVDVDEPDSVWANYILGDSVQKNGCSEISDFDDTVVIPRLLSMYDEMSNFEKTSKRSED